MTRTSFVSAIARSRYDEHGNCTFDGKIGLLPITKEVTTLRASKNKQAGAVEIKTINVTKQVYKEVCCGCKEEVGVFRVIIDKFSWFADVLLTSTNDRANKNHARINDVK